MVLNNTRCTIYLTQHLADCGMLINAIYFLLEPLLLGCSIKIKGTLLVKKKNSVSGLTGFCWHLMALHVLI